VDGEFAECFSVEGDLLLRETSDEDRIAYTFGPQRSVKARNPQRSEVALLLSAIAEGMPPRLQHRLIGFLKRRVVLIHEPASEFADFLVTPMTDDSAFDAHDCLGREQRLHRSLKGGMDKHGAVEALLTLLLLLQQMIPAMPFDRKLPPSGFPESLLGAAVGFHLWHGEGG